MTDLYPTSALEDAAKLFSGGTPRKSNPEYWNGPIPWLTPKDMGDWKGLTENTVTEKAIGNGTRLAPEHAIFIAVRGMSLHNEIRIVRSKRRLTFNQDIKAVVAKDGILPEFLYYALLAAKPQLLDWVSAAGHGTGVMATDRLLSVAIPIIDGNTQAAIAAILSSLDDKIELNRRMNETLETLAQAIFKDWFVDFGPTRRKQEGATDPVAILGNLIPDPAGAQETAALFPDRFSEDGLPEGWKIQRLGEVASELRRGISPAYLESGGVAVLNQKCVRDGMVKVLAARRHDPNKKNVRGRELKLGDVLINSTGVGTLGRVGQIWDLTETTVADSHVTVVRTDGSRIGPAYLGTSLISRQNEIEALGEGSTGQTELSRQILGQLPVIVASSFIRTTFEDLVRPLISRRVIAWRESNTLAETRDYLLPKLMSGAVRVRDAEKIAEDGVKSDAKQASSTNSVFGVDLFGSPVLFPDQETERDAVMVASVVNTFRRGREVVGNVKIQKGTYFIRRRAGLSVSSFEKQAAGPYDANLNYEGGKPDALAKQWIAPSTSAGKAREYDGSAPGAKIKEIAPLVERYALKDAIEWATKHLASKSRDELECLATVDFAMQTLRAQSVNPTLQLVKADIASDPKWKPKLKKPHFSDDAIRKAISDLDKWFGEEGRAG